MDLSFNREFRRLVGEAVGGVPVKVGESFNGHFTTDHAFIKVSRPKVLPFRATNDLYFARAMGEAGIPTALPLVDEPLAFTDEGGFTRWVTFWERKERGPELAPHESLSLCHHWINKLWALAPPSWTSELTLDDFIHAAHVRLDGNPDPLVPKVLDALTELSHSPHCTHPKLGGPVHGDLHPGNLLSTREGVLVIDWESACLGPMEWDAVQTLRYAPDEQRPALRELWLSNPSIDEVALDFYYTLRSLTSFSHLLAVNERNGLFHATLAHMGWDAP